VTRRSASPAEIPLTSAEIAAARGPWLYVAYGCGSAFTKETAMKMTMLAMALVASLGCGGKAETPEPGTTPKDGKPGKVIDLTDNKEVERVALESLQAYRDKNLERLADLGPLKAREKLIFLEPRNPNYETLLGDSSWRMKALKAWDGKLIRIARGVDDNAIGWFHEDATDMYGVEVRKDNGKWYFFDLKQQSKSGAPAPAPTPTPTPTPAPAP